MAGMMVPEMAFSILSQKAGRFSSFRVRPAA